MQSPVPFTIVTGFLGSGKTTLINYLLMQFHEMRLAIIVNELGDIGLDGALYDSNSRFVEMSNGCLCCVLNDDLTETLRDLAHRTDYDAVILETTGIADPLPIVWPFKHPDMRDRFRFAGILTVVDGLNFSEQKESYPEVKLQIERADFIYVSKTDISSAEHIDKIKADLHEINPKAHLLLTEGVTFLPAVFDLAEDKNFSRVRQIDHRTAKTYETRTHFLGEHVILEEAEDRLSELSANVLRAKAIIYDWQKHKWFALHSVCGRIDFYDWHAVSDELKNKMVVIELAQK